MTGLRLVSNVEADDREIEAVIAASIANYVRDNAERPSGAILVLITQDGGNSVTWCNADRGDLSLAAARLLQHAVEE